MTSDHRSPAARVLGLLLGQFLALVALLLAGRRAPFAGVPWAHGFGGWFAGAPPIDAVAVVAYRAALLMATWVLLGTLLHLAAGLSHVPALVRVTAHLALPAARRAVAAAVITVGVASPAVACAATDGPATVRVRDGRAVVTTSVPAPVAPETVTPAPRPTGVIVVVQPGDSLWSIAERTVNGGDVAAHWVALCDLNTPRLRSGDPSLLEPGEEILLPG